MADDPPPPARGPGPLLASGRDADIFDIGDGKVLRRCRKSNSRMEFEARVMRYAAQHGLPVPKVFPLVVDHHPDRDIVMERIDGVTMLDDLEQRPWKALSHARLLARLQREIAAVEAPDWMITSGMAKSPERQTKHPDSVLHLDFHPLNVLLSRQGPVIIDWTNASGGPAGFDAAHSYVIMATFETEEPKDRIAQQLFVRAFRRLSGPRAIDAFLAVACDHRLADRNLTPGERTNVAALRKRALSGTGGTRPRS